MFGEKCTQICKWEKSLHVEKGPFQFPPDDLLQDLVNIFFGFNKCTPLLHEPTFRKSLREGCQFYDVDFAHLVLLVCAIGSQFSADPRVLLDGDSSRRSAGLKYIDQVNLLQPATLHRANLQQLQAYCVRYFLTHCHTPFLPRALPSCGSYFKTRLLRLETHGRDLESQYDWLRIEALTGGSLMNH
jgi:hypothetical protein